MSWTIVNIIMGSLMVVLAYQSYLIHHIFFVELDMFFALINFGMMFWNISRESTRECPEFEI